MGLILQSTDIWTIPDKVNTGVKHSNVNHGRLNGHLFTQNKIRTSFLLHLDKATVVKKQYKYQLFIFNYNYKRYTYFSKKKSK